MNLTKRQMLEAKQVALAQTIFETARGEGWSEHEAASWADGVIGASAELTDQSWDNWVSVCPECNGHGEVQVGYSEMGRPLYDLCPLCRHYHVQPLDVIDSPF